MTVSVASFRKDLPEFGSLSAYPDSVIAYWIAIAQIMLGTGSGSPPKVASFEGSIAGSVLTVASIDFGSISLLPLLLAGDNLPLAAPAILQQLTGNPFGGVGTYKLNFTAPAPIPLQNFVALQNSSLQGGNPFWGAASLTANSPPTTIADFATEMWVAHQIVMEKQAIQAASTGGDPGTKIGIISSKSVNGVSVSFDVGSITGAGSGQQGGGYYNQTIYGMRFWRLARIRGSGPIQIGIGYSPPFLFFNNGGLYGAGNAWAGPYPGIAPGDTGFSS